MTDHTNLCRSEEVICTPTIGVMTDFHNFKNNFLYFLKLSLGNYA